jgi:hypothetical protein
MLLIVAVLLAWLAVSFPVSVLIGRWLKSRDTVRNTDAAGDDVIRLPPAA